MEAKQEPGTPELTADEQEIIAWYRQLPENDRKNLLTQARSGDTPSNKTNRTLRAAGVF